MFRIPLSSRSIQLWFAVPVILLLVVIGTVAFRPRSAASSNSMSKLPSVVVWAWERPEQLDFIDPAKVGVAFLAATITLRDDTVLVRPRLQPLTVPDGSLLIAVARIESDRKAHPHLTPEQLIQSVGAIDRLAKLPKVVAVQIDFDALLSERAFYRNLLLSLRKTLPPTTALSITALASWCQGDNWLDELPIDEAVPMLFRMGAQEHAIREQLSISGNFNSTKCQNSVGYSIDEPHPVIPTPKRSYYFNLRSWTADSIQELLRHHELQPTTY
jgi:hypothetical protein